jgi:uncharacterized membrane protein (UPF0127 family)
MMKNSYWTTYTIVGIIVLVSAVFMYTHSQQADDRLLRELDNNISNSSTTTIVSPPKKVEDMTIDDAWDIIYPDTRTMEISSTSVKVSIARTATERIQGLSNTPYLPESVVKFFIFDGTGFHSIWMKDMKYSIDIIWVDKKKTIVHIEKNVSPDSYPESFTTEVPSLYVIETAAGFVDKNEIKLGDTVTIPKKREPLIDFN